MPTILSVSFPPAKLSLLLNVRSKADAALIFRFRRRHPLSDGTENQRDSQISTTPSRLIKSQQNRIDQKLSDAAGGNAKEGLTIKAPLLNGGND